MKKSYKQVLKEELIHKNYYDGWTVKGMEEKLNKLENKDVKTDLSKGPKKGQLGIVDKTFITEGEEGERIAKVRIREERIPNIGDKMASRAGQKGTVGIILPEKDMPFDENGIKPDIIINPHAIPSRMTIGQLKETLLGMVLLELGLFGDGTSFNDLPVAEICKILSNHGFQSKGNSVLMNGMTGEQLETSIFMGPTFYQRLKHMVNDKQHARGTGPMVVLTRQPAEGRGRDGGLRCGEMERDGIMAHGCSRFIKGRLYDSSDKFHVYTCKKCGMFAVYNDERNIHHCKTCNNRTAFARINIPYAMKLTTQELISMNIAPRFITE